ncbi:MAG: hypothetical protein PHS92_01925 [Candidatus Gracilibacteria bacterium]|nr:hypothetical protein [Candidatus Gracilibacteria bacterium]
MGINPGNNSEDNYPGNESSKNNVYVMIKENPAEMSEIQKDQELMGIASSISLLLSFGTKKAIENTRKRIGDAGDYLTSEKDIYSLLNKVEEDIEDLLSRTEVYIGGKIAIGLDNSTRKIKSIKDYFKKEENLEYLKERTKYTALAILLFVGVAFTYNKLQKNKSELSQNFIDKNGQAISESIKEINSIELIKTGLRESLEKKGFTNDDIEKILRDTEKSLKKNNFEKKLDAYLLHKMSDQEFQVYLFGILYGVLYTFALYTIAKDKNLSSSIAYVGFFTANGGLFFSNGFQTVSFGYFIAWIMGMTLVAVNEKIAKDIRDGKAASGGIKKMVNYLSKNSPSELFSVFKEVLDNRNISPEEVSEMIELHAVKKEKPTVSE